MCLVEIEALKPMPRATPVTQGHRRTKSGGDQRAQG
jgi:hypothetical protein